MLQLKCARFLEKSIETIEKSCHDILCAYRSQNCKIHLCIYIQCSSVIHQQCLYTEVTILLTLKSWQAEKNSRYFTTRKLVSIGSYTSNCMSEPVKMFGFKPTEVLAYIIQLLQIVWSAVMSLTDRWYKIYYHII